MRPAGKDNSENKLGWSLQRPPSYANAGKAQKKYRNKICIGLETGPGLKGTFNPPFARRAAVRAIPARSAEPPDKA